jgi:hypothetical protein
MAVIMPISDDGQAAASVQMHAKYAAPTRSALQRSLLAPPFLWHGGAKPLIVKTLIVCNQIIYIYLLLS